MTKPSALIVEGGAMRGIFASGVLDAFLEEDYRPFDMAIGVSAGSTNLVGYLAGNHGRSRRILTEYATRREFIDPTRFLRAGHLVDVGWLWEATKNTVPLDVQRFATCGTPLLVVTTEVATGQAHYLQATPENMDQVFPASCALPLVYRAFPTYNGIAMTDGGIADSIPVLEAYRRGARDMTIILSRPLGYRKKASRMPWLTASLMRRHPQLATAMLARAQRYNEALTFIERPPEDCRVRVLAPDLEFPVGRLTRDLGRLQKGYEQGHRAASKMLRCLKSTSAA
ncbi:patatin-like phospholipase family protein [Pseudomonas aeruginosa]|uniref:patatin-like phospholipase family protein n=1 Tax=Pseudomonas aeruginosa TaxID=287 RepID=UPI003EE41C0E